MSRGHGKIETTIIQLLTQNTGRKFSSLELAALVYGVDQIKITGAQAAAVRRALSNLKRKRKVWDLGRFYEEGGGSHEKLASRFPRSMWASEETAHAHAVSIIKGFGPEYLDAELVELAKRRV